MERELFVWRLVLVVVAAGILVAFAAPQSEKEIRLTSARGDNTVTLTAEGLVLSSQGKPVAQLGFETIGDGNRQVALMKLNGFISVESGSISVGQTLKQRVAIDPERIWINKDGVTRAEMRNGLLSLADPTGRTKAELSADEKGLTSLALVWDNKLIAELASEGRFTVTDPPTRKSAALLLNDFSAPPKSTMISPSGQTNRGQ